MQKRYIFILATILILIILVICYLLFYRDPVDSLKNKSIYYEGEWYDVYDVNGDAMSAAAILASVNEFNISFLRHLKDKYITNPSPYTSELRIDAVKFLLSNYNQNKLSDNIPTRRDSTTAFVKGKGSDFKLCLRAKDKNAKGLKYNSLHDLDTILFVNLHELSHLSIKDMDHSTLFWNTFKFMLYEAKMMTGRTIMVKDTYCGLDVTYNPLDDETLVLYDVQN
jgi:hypothetical protein